MSESPRTTELDAIRTARELAYRDAASEIHREARWTHEMTMRGTPPDPLDRLLMIERILMARADALPDSRLPERQSPIPDATVSGGMIESYAPAPMNERDCTGASDCPAGLHVHGCYADLNGSACDDPDDHSTRSAQVTNHPPDNRDPAGCASEESADV